MKNIEELRDRLYSLISQTAELKADIEQLEKEAKEEKPVPPHPRWKPEKGGTYYDIYFGRASVSDWDGFVDDSNNFAIGNVFKTEAEAEFAIERLKVLAEMREWAGEQNDPYVIFYGGHSELKITDHSSWAWYGEMRFASVDDAEGCIKAVGEERLKKYYFGITEE